MSSINFTPKAWEDYLFWQENDKRILKQINKLLKDIVRNGYSGIGHPEPLKGDKAGYYSRHIDDTNRLVYKINDDIIEVVSCRFHYSK